MTVSVEAVLVMDPPLLKATQEICAPESVSCALVRV